MGTLPTMVQPSIEPSNIPENWPMASSGPASCMASGYPPMSQASSVPPNMAGLAPKN